MRYRVLFALDCCSSASHASVELTHFDALLVNEVGLASAAVKCEVEPSVVVLVVLLLVGAMGWRFESGWSGYRVGR